MRNISFKSGTDRTASKAVALAGVVCIVLAACSSDSADPATSAAVSSPAAATTPPQSTPASSQPAGSADSLPSAGAATTPAVTVPATAAVDDEADKAAAEGALLVLSDFDKGWSELPSDDGETVKRIQRDVGKCAGSDEETTIDFGGGRANTGHFKSPNDDTVAEAVAFAPSIDAATQRMTGLGAPEFATCLHDVYEDAAKDLLKDSGSTLKGITVGKLNVTPAGDDTVAFRVTISASKSGLTAEIYADNVVFRSGRMVASVSVQSTFSPFDIDETERLVALAASRMTDT
jgi:hypothetical protein